MESSQDASSTSVHLHRSFVTYGGWSLGYLVHADSSSFSLTLPSKWRSGRSPCLLIPSGHVFSWWFTSISSRYLALPSISYTTQEALTGKQVRSRHESARLCEENNLLASFSDGKEQHQLACLLHFNLITTLKAWISNPLSPWIPQF